MAAHIVDVSFDPKGDLNGRMLWQIDGADVPGRGVVVHAGDTVRWRSDEGEMTVRFAGDEPFGERVFKAAAGQLTEPPALVRADAPLNKAFQCEITLLGISRQISGVETQPPPG